MNLRTHRAMSKGKEEANDIATVVLPPDLSEAELGRSMLRMGNKALSKFVERKEKPLLGVKGDHFWMQGEISNYLSEDDPQIALLDHANIAAQFETVAPVNNRHHAHATKEAIKKLGQESLAPEEFEPTNLREKITVKKPSKFLPREDVITKFSAFHAGSQYGTASYVFYRVPDYVKSIFKKRPWPRGGKIAYMIDVARNDLRQNYHNIMTLQENIEKLRIQQLRYWVDKKSTQRTEEMHATMLQKSHAQICLMIFLLEDNFHSLHTGLENLTEYQKLYKANATLNIYGTGLVKKKGAPEKPTQFYADRDHFYEEEKALMEQLLAHRKDVLDDAKDHLANYELTPEKYENWKNENWREVRVQFNKYKGAGCITGQAIQGFVIVMINTGIAIGLKSVVAAVAAGLYVLTTVADVIQTALRTHFEDELIRGGYAPFEDTTRLTTDTEHRERTRGYIEANPEVAASIQKSRERVILVHKYLDTLHRVEVVINELKGFVNTGVNTAGTVTGAPTSSTRPALNSQPREKRTSRMISKTHTMFSKSYGQPVTSQDSRLRL